MAIAGMSGMPAEAASPPWFARLLHGRDRAQLVVIAYETGVASPGQHHPGS
jgi:hypothetical protein